MNDKDQFIEIKRVIGNKDKKNDSTQPETIKVSMIDSFRPWHKGPNDLMIKGDMTILIMKSRESDVDAENKGRVRTMLIEESYKKFLKRMNAYVIVKELEDSDSH